MRRFGIGQPMRRVEDRRFLTGKGRYTDDICHEGQLYGYFIRSPIAHAEITSLDVTDAAETNGVHLILTAEDVKQAGIGEIPCQAPLPGIAQKDRPILANGRVRYVGEPVAFIVADSLNAAREAADLVEVDYEPLDAVADCALAVKPDAAQVYEDVAENRCFEWETGDADKTREAFEKAAHISQVHIRNNRVAPNSMEPRAINASYEPETGFEVYLGTQGVAAVQPAFAELMGVGLEKMHVITPDVGGGFGMKTFVYSEYIAVLLAAKRLEKPVKWTCDRTEAFLTDAHGRDLVSTGELALDAQGHVLAYRIKTLANMGAHLSNFAPAIATLAPLQVVPGPYRIPVMHQHVTGVYTNTAPVDAYRGAGRPEAAYLLERLMHQAARDLGLTPDELHRRNFVRSDEMPYTNAAGAVYDSGDFARNMDDAMRKADWAGFRQRKAAALEKGLYRGIGLAYYVECTLGAPTEDIDVVFTDKGRVEVSVGTQSNGQGHETAYAQVLGDRIGVDPHLIDVIQGDTARKNTGGGTGGSRSLQMIGNACVAAGDAVIEQAKALMAHLYDVDAGDVRFQDDHLEIAGTNQRIGILELAEQARNAELPDTLAQGLNLTASYTKPASTFPNGCHICEVEVDPETGVVRIERYTVVDDFGVVINPMLVTGQVHGGIVQGIGQALGETVIYDDEAQLLSASFMDYAMPKADEISPIDFSYNEIPCKTNPLGLKGCGEAGTIGACPSTINAILDALTPLGVQHIDMPASPMAVWQAIQEARQAA